MATLGRLVAHLELQTASFDRGLNRAAQLLQTQNAQMRRQNRLLQQSFDQVKRSVDTVKASFAALGAGLVVRNIVNATTQFERINNTLRVGAGSAEAAAQAYTFVRNEAQRLGLDLRTAADQFASLTAAARGTTLQGQESRDIFTAVAEAMTVLGRSSDQTGGALLAIEQIISKGKVSAEELRGQLGERLPGAFQIAARSVGITTQELDAMLKAGELLAEDFLPRFADELRRTFGGEAEAASQSLQASINRLNTAVFEFTAQVGQGGVAQAITDFSQGLTEAAQGSENLARQLGAGLGAAIRATGEAFLFVTRYFKEFSAAVAAFVAFRAAAIFVAVAGAAFQMANALRLAALGMLALNTAMGKNVIIKLAQVSLAAAAAIGTYFALTKDTTAETEKLTSELEELESQLGGGGGSGGIAGAAGDAANALDSMLESARRENEQLAALRTAHLGYGASVETVNNAIEIDNQLRAAKITRMEAEKSGLLALLVANQNYRAEIERLQATERQRETTSAIIAAEPTRAQIEETESLLNEPFRNFLSSVQSETASAFEEVYSGGVKSFSDLFKTAKDLAIKFAAEVSAALVMRPVLQGFGGFGGGDASLASQLGPAAGRVPGGGPISLSEPITGVPAGQQIGGFNFAGLAGASALGGLGGAALGSGLFGGGTSTTIGGGLGGALGAGAGFALTPILGPLGPVLGGVLGSVGGSFIGSLFGGGDDKTKGSFSGGIGRASFTGESEIADFVKKIDNSILGLLDSRQKSIAQKLKSSGSINVKGELSQSDIEGIGSERIGAVASALGFNRGRILQGDTDQALQNLQTAVQLQQTIEDLASTVSPFIRQMEDVNQQFREARESAKEFGIATSGLRKAQREAIDEIRRAREETRKQTDAQIAGLLDPFEALSDPLEAFKTQLEFAQLNPADQLARAQADFERISGLAEGGDVAALSQLQGASQLLIDLAERFGASPGGAAAREDVADAIATALERIEAARDAAESSIQDEVRRASREEIKVLGDLVQEVRNVAAEIRRSSRKVGA